MRFEINSLLPCVTFFAAGRFLTGLLVTFLQLTVLLWPFASRMAREFNETREIERMLKEISHSYKIPDHQWVSSRRRFRDSGFVSAQHSHSSAFGRRKAVSVQVA